MRAAVTLAVLGATCSPLWGCAGASTTPKQALLPAARAALQRFSGVTVSPLPGTPDASPSTQVSFLGGTGTRVFNVRVTGSETGVHAGALKRYSTRTGASFLSSKPFRVGETVSVSALVSTGRSRPVKRVGTTFTIGSEAPVSETPFAREPGDPQAIQRYATLPGAAPSTVTITTPATRGAAPGYLFMAPYQGDGTPGLMIARQNGGLVWFHQLPPGEVATNFQVQRYHGRRVLTWWQGHVLRVGFGQGEDLVYDSSYRPIATIRAGNGYQADLHEIRLTPHGTAWIDSYDPIHMDLSSVGGQREGIIEDCVVQEIDVKTGLVMWEWHTLGHVPLRDSYNPASKSPYPWDYAHVNSVDPGSSHDVLLSARNTWAMYDVDVRTGAIRWELGGRDSTFKLGPGVQTYWQHDAEWRPDGLISVFDNGDSPNEEKQSRGVLLRANTATSKATLVDSFVNPTSVLQAPAQGNTQALPRGDWLLGYGNLPNFTEYDASGHVLLDGTLGRGVQDFRTYLSPWTALPAEPPAIVARRSGSSVKVWASWNGATDVASWRVLAGEDATSLIPSAKIPDRGFQSSTTLPGKYAYVAVQALDASNRPLRSSPVTRVRER